jgi:hypothetical protein
MFSTDTDKMFCSARNDDLCPLFIDKFNGIADKIPPGSRIGR